MASSLTTTPAGMDRAAELAAVINEACEELRRLPRLDVYSPTQPPVLTVEWVRRALETGDQSPEASRIVWDGERSVAALTLGFNGGSVARIGWLGVLPAYRGRGLGASLIGAAAGEARARGHAALVTGKAVDSRWEGVCGLLEQEGFVWTDPDACNRTMLMDLSTWQPREPKLPAGFELRTWRDGDEEGWTAVKRAAFGDDTPADWFRRVWGSQPEFDPEDWYLCVHEGRAVGIAAAVVRRLPEGGHGCCIEWVGMMPEYRGLGLGRAMMTACLNHASRFEADPMVLVTQRFRTAAVTLYESLGFRWVNQYRHYRLELAAQETEPAAGEGG